MESLETAFVFFIIFFLTTHMGSIVDFINIYTRKQKKGH